jgi:GntR family transcriptional regulator, transcriptional repressor for pyruvate dehydrogenase complex
LIHIIEVVNKPEIPFVEGAALELGPIRVEKSYQALAGHLRDQILRGAILPGANLPNERDLGDQTGLSRGSVREALRVLEAEGLVSTRPGRNGGRIARLPGAEGVGRSLDFFIRGEQVEFTALLETVETLEPALAALAALHCNPTDVAAMEELSREMSDPKIGTPRYQALNWAWHLAVARASHNAILIAIMQALGPRLHDPHVEGFISAEMRKVVNGAHARVQRAIVAGDAEAARRRMARHLRAYRLKVEEVGPDTVALT